MADIRDIEAGLKSHETKIAQFGPGEPKRAGDQMTWTKNNPGQGRGDNPYRRERVYPQAELERAQKFKQWRETNPNGSHDENPYAWTRAST